MGIDGTRSVGSQFQLLPVDATQEKRSIDFCDLARRAMGKHFDQNEESIHKQRLAELRTALIEKYGADFVEYKSVVLYPESYSVYGIEQFINSRPTPLSLGEPIRHSPITLIPLFESALEIDDKDTAFLIFNVFNHLETKSAIQYHIKTEDDWIRHEERLLRLVNFLNSEDFQTFLEQHGNKEFKEFTDELEKVVFQ